VGRFRLDEKLAKRLSSGVPTDLQLRDSSGTLGTCRITYDLWFELFVVRRGTTSDREPALERALALCLDPENASQNGRAVAVEQR